MSVPCDHLWWPSTFTSRIQKPPLDRVLLSQRTWSNGTLTKPEPSEHVSQSYGQHLHQPYEVQAIPDISFLVDIHMLNLKFLTVFPKPQQWGSSLCNNIKQTGNLLPSENLNGSCPVGRQCSPRAYLPQPRLLVSSLLFSCIYSETSFFYLSSRKLFLNGLNSATWAALKSQVNPKASIIDK